MGLIALVGLAVLAGSQPIVATLTRPLVTNPEPMSQLLAVRELADGRVLAIDFKEKTVHLLDQTLTSTATLGREGKGPGEFSMPLGLVPMPGDVTYLVDPLSQRVLPIQPDGSFGAPIAFSTLGLGFVMAAPIADERGRLFFQAMSADVRALTADSVPILRLDPGGKKTDTLAFYRPQKLEMSTEGGKVRMGAMKMFAPEEAWTATADGRVVRAIPEPYQLVIYANGKPTAGPPVEHSPIKVTEEEKAEARTAWEQGMAAGRAAAAQAGGRGAGQFTAAEPQFATVKGPFAGRTALLPAPNGEVWVQRSRPFADKGGLYDRFDVKGRRIGQVKLNPKSRVIGFGKGAVYVVRLDEDELQYLERYRFPTAP